MTCLSYWLRTTRHIHWVLYLYRNALIQNKNLKCLKLKNMAFVPSVPFFFCEYLYHAVTILIDISLTPTTFWCYLFAIRLMYYHLLASDKVITILPTFIYIIFLVLVLFFIVKCDNRVMQTIISQHSSLLKIKCERVIEHMITELINECLF